MPAQDDNKNLHHKPTPEELEANAQKALDEAAKLDPEAVDPDEEDETPDDTKDDSEGKEEEKAETPVDESFKKRYADSTREAQILANKNKKLTEAIEEAGNIPEPTEEELILEYPDWDILSETEKKIAKRSYLNDQRFERIDAVTKDFKDLDVWTEKVDKYIDDPQILIDNPALEGKVDEFKIYVTKPSRINVDWDLLIGAFLNEVSKKASNNNKGQMFEQGSGGDGQKGKKRTDKISIEQAAILRKNPKTYPLFVKKLREGKIETEKI